jgi:plasmid stability protein
MGQILIRGLDDNVIQAVKDRAKANGRSAEAEARFILTAAATIGNAPPSKRFILDFVGIARTGRTPEEITAEIRAMRDEWDAVP